jgi:hypothetical protein
MNHLSGIARPGSYEYTGIRLSGQSRGKPYCLLWIPVFAGMKDTVRSCLMPEFSPAVGEKSERTEKFFGCFAK